MRHEIGWAAKKLCLGSKVRRASWPPSAYLIKYPDTDVHIVFHSDITHRYWMSSNFDLFANDWEYFNAE